MLMGGQPLLDAVPPVRGAAAGLPKRHSEGAEPGV
jgi:hypothetical protein